MRVTVIPLYGSVNEFPSIIDARQFLNLVPIAAGSVEFHRFDLHIELPNGDRCNGSFSERNKAIEFLAFIEGEFVN